MTDKIKIEKGVPLPARYLKKYPFEEMKPGDSFSIVEPCKKTARKQADLLRSACVYFVKKKNPAWRFTTRVTKDGVRVWRIK